MPLSDDTNTTTGQQELTNRSPIIPPSPDPVSPNVEQDMNCADFHDELIPNMQHNLISGSPELHNIDVIVSYDQLEQSKSFISPTSSSERIVSNICQTLIVWKPFTRNGCHISRLNLSGQIL